jgi:hypothetical protein
MYTTSKMDHVAIVNTFMTHVSAMNKSSRNSELNMEMLFLKRPFILVNLFLDKNWMLPLVEVRPWSRNDSAYLFDSGSKLFRKSSTLWEAIPTSFPVLQCEDKARHEEALVQSRATQKMAVFDSYSSRSGEIFVNEIYKSSKQVNSQKTSQSILFMCRVKFGMNQLKSLKIPLCFLRYTDISGDFQLQAKLHPSCI